MAGKKDSAWEPRRSETPALGLDMDDHLFPWGDITGLPEFSNTSVTTDPLEFLFSPLVSDPGGLSASDLSFPPSELSLRTETVAEGTPQCFSLVASASKPLPSSSGPHSAPDATGEEAGLDTAVSTASNTVMPTSSPMLSSGSSSAPSDTGTVVGTAVSTPSSSSVVPSSSATFSVGLRSAPAATGEDFVVGTAVSTASVVSAVPTAVGSPSAQDDPVPVLSIPEVSSHAFIPALPPLRVLPNKDGFSSVDFEEAARLGRSVSELRAQPKKRVRKSLSSAELKSSQDETQTQTQVKKALSSAERFSRPLGITGWTALGKFQHVKASPLHLWVKSERYPQLAGTGDFTPAVPILKALLPVKPSSSLPHSLTYLECGFVDPSLPLDRCRVLLPNLSSWQSHQFLCHALGYLCSGCSNWMETESALQAHMLECDQQKG